MPSFAALLLLAALLAGCSTLPPRGTLPTSTALPHRSTAALTQLALASQPAAPAGPSAFRLLPTGEFALGARVSMAQRAQFSLDVQAYHIHRDTAGLAVLRELRDAALRGVRVRLLVDDFHVNDIEPVLADLQAYANVEVRLFNPMPLRGGAPIFRLLLSPGEFERYNHRMHNKLFLADNAMAVFGGRNLGDEYFMGHAQANFIDLDVLATGEVVRELSQVFDRYWNSEAAWPLRLVRRDAATRTPEVAQARFQAAVQLAMPAAPAYTTDPLGRPPVEVEMQQGRLTLHAAAAQVFADPPEKALAVEPRQLPSEAMSGLLNVIQGARHEVNVVSPYFVPGPIGMPMMAAARQAGVRTAIYTNSLGTTDEPLVHHRYSTYRAAMLKLGVEVLEFSPVAVQRSLSFGNFGRSLPRLHAKVASVDRRHLLVGSVNLDGRSAVANTEMAVAIDSPALATELQRALEGGRTGLLYRLKLGPDGEQVQWHARDEHGREQVLTEEPGADPWVRFKLWLQAWFVDERHL